MQALRISQIIHRLLMLSRVAGFFAVSMDNGRRQSHLLNPQGSHLSPTGNSEEPVPESRHAIGSIFLTTPTVISSETPIMAGGTEQTPSIIRQTRMFEILISLVFALVSLAAVAGIIFAMFKPLR